MKGQLVRFLHVRKKDRQQPTSALTGAYRKDQ